MPKRLRIFTAVAILVLLIAPLVYADAAPGVFITEVQTNSGNSGSEEFIEIYNNTDQAVDLADTANDGETSWQIQYFSSTKVVQPDFSWDSETPTGVITLTGTVPAHDYYVISTYQPGGYVADQTYDNPHLADTAGGVQLVESSDSVKAQDHVGWSNANQPPNGLYKSPPAGGSLQRQVNEQGSYTDASGKPGPFLPSSASSPKDSWQTPPPDNDSPSPDPNNDNSQLLDQPDTLRITELLPNPASPATDANDEYVELYNFGDEPIELHGFTIQSGQAFSYSYTIEDEVIEPHSYEIFTSGETTLSLANSGGRARVLDPSGQTIDESATYNEASEGQAWALFGEQWQWTTTPTPASDNVLSAVAASSKTAIKKAAAPKAKKTSAKSAAKKTAGTLGSAANGNDPQAEDQPPALHPLVLAGVGGAALLYGAYEYRTDLANRFYQLKRYRETRRAARAAVAGR
jgi:hypothetical protein